MAELHLHAVRALPASARPQTEPRGAWLRSSAVLLAQILFFSGYLLTPGTTLHAQAWSGFLEPSRAIDWSSITEFAVPTYTTLCRIQPRLQTGTASAAANTRAIQNALASCDSTHNVVSIPAGTYYIAGLNFGSQGKQVVRGAGPNATYVYSNATVNMMSNPSFWGGSQQIVPGSGTRQCLWTGTDGVVGSYRKEATSLTLDNCPGGSGPVVGQTLVLDQANDRSDTGGVFTCDSYTSTVNPSQPCTVQDGSPTNADGRSVNNITHSEKQIVMVQAVTGSGTGPYTVTIHPGLYFNNVRIHSEYSGTDANVYPGAYWIGFVQNDGLEDLTIDHTQNGYVGITMDECYQCWIRNVRSVNAARAHVLLYQSMMDVVRDDYFYGNQAHSSGAYGIEIESSSQVLIENNVIQQATTPIMVGQTTGSVIGYNLTIDNSYDGGGSAPSYAMPSFPSHNAGSAMNLWEGNNMLGVNADDTWGSTYATTLFRNLFTGWASGKTRSTVPIALRAFARSFNIVGNVLGQPDYHRNYEAYATSPTESVNAGIADTSIYSLGFTGVGGDGTCGSPPVCDRFVRATTLRWGNWDVVTNGTKWEASKASAPAAANVNSTSAVPHIATLAHSLPASLYYTSIPFWWPSGKLWPPLGSDVSSGNLGICSGSYSGAQATSTAQCNGGTVNPAYAGHAYSIPAQDCYLNVMHGPPDGTGGLLSFDAGLCYTMPETPTGSSSLSGPAQHHTGKRLQRSSPYQR